MACKSKILKSRVFSGTKLRLRKSISMNRNAVGTSAEVGGRRRKSAEWRERVATLITQWRDVDWLSSSNRLNILQVDIHIYIVICLTEESQVRRRIDRTVTVAVTLQVHIKNIDKEGKGIREISTSFMDTLIHYKLGCKIWRRSIPCSSCSAIIL